MFTFHQVTLKCYITWPWARKNDIPLLLLGDLNARHPIWDKNFKAPNKNGTILEDIMSWYNVQIQNDQNSTYVHKRGSSTIDLVLTSGISDLKCHQWFEMSNKRIWPYVSVLHQDVFLATSFSWS